MAYVPLAIIGLLAWYYVINHIINWWWVLS